MKMLLIQALILISSSASGAMLDADLAKSVNGIKQRVKACRDKTNSVGEGACFTVALKSAEDVLNRLVQQRSANLGSLPENGAEIARNFAESQKAWLKYRDAHCAYAKGVLDPDYGDEGAPKAMCPYTETIRRVITLDNLAPEVQPG